MDSRSRCAHYILKMAAIEVAVLGRPRICVDGREVPLHGGQLLLALRLALAGRVPVTPNALLETWPDDSGTDGALRVALSRLRARLGDDVVRRVGHGYVLGPAVHLDADDFTRLVRQSNEPAATRDERAGLLDAALGLWTADAYAGIDGVHWVDHEVVRLSELREQSIDRRFELLLDGADAAERASIVPELVEAVDRRPDREHRSALAATTLYRCGRQADALAMIASTRHVLLDGYGLEIGQELRDLELAILRHEVVEAGLGVTDEQRGQITSRLHAAAGLLTAGADDALAIAEEAVQLARLHGDHEHLPRALVLAAQAMVLTGNGDAGPLLDEAQRIARTAGDGDLLARVALVRFGRGVADDRHDALIELAEPLDMLPSSAPVRVELLCASAAIISLTGAGPAAQRLIEAAEREHHVVGSVRTEAVWLAARAIVSAVDGRDPEYFRGDAERSLQLARTAGEPILLTIAYQAVLRLAYATGDLPRVDSLLEPLAAASERALLPFGIVRRHLCEVTNALARGQLDEVRGLIATTREVGHRLRTHAVDTATASQELLLELELDVLGGRGDALNALAAAQPHGQGIMIAALARPHDRHAHDRLVSGVAHLPHNDARPAVLALSALAAADWRDPLLGQRCLDELEPLGDRTVAVGFGSIVIGSARVYAGVAHLAVGHYDHAKTLLERGVQLSIESTGWLWAAHARLWLAETLLERGADGDVDEAIAHIEVVVASDCFRPEWRVGHHAALLRAAIAEAHEPGALRDRRRRLANAS